jgi:molybdate transport system substrate-binding protein
VTVLAAASLTDAFTAIGEAFEEAHPGTTVRFSFAGSQQLATQALEGAPADVLASADGEQMQRVVDGGAVAEEPTIFTGNRLAIAVEPGNPRDVRSVADLADPSLAVVLAAEAVPAGQYARQLLEARGVTVAPVSLEADVRSALAKVSLGEADAAIVYASDVVAAGDEVAGVTIPDGDNVVARYPVAVLADAPSADGARDFVAFAQSTAGQDLLAAHGFTPAP